LGQTIQANPKIAIPDEDPQCSENEEEQRLFLQKTESIALFLFTFEDRIRIACYSIFLLCIFAVLSPNIFPAVPWLFWLFFVLIFFWVNSKVNSRKVITKKGIEIIEGFRRSNKKSFST
jgi:hypothetical protein